VLIAADADAPGIKAAREAALHFIRLGRKVRIARPPAGSDFNDLLKAE
jgi:DNA primase